MNIFGCKRIVCVIQIVHQKQSFYIKISVKYIDIFSIQKVQDVIDNKSQKIFNMMLLKNFFHMPEIIAIENSLSVLN